jgi:threonine dehydrogenase-like Zn-dependent dehydrogenase
VLAAVTRSPGEMVVENVGGPRRARPGHVIVRPEAVGICGSDFHLFSGDVAALSGASDFCPRVQGHEVAAVVADPGTATTVVAGMSSGAEPVRPGIFPEKEIDVLGSSTATAADFRYAISLVTSVRENISKLFSHHFPLARAAEAFEFAMSRPPDAVKIVVNVN